MSIEETLKGQDKESYGENYQNHLIEQYKIYVELADRVSQRRLNSMTTFFTSVNTLLLSGYGILASLKLDKPNSNKWLILITISGILLCINWRGVTDSYKKLLTGKFRIIHEIENNLPMRLFSAEWESISFDSDCRYTRYTSIEKIIPLVFLVIYSILLISALISFF